MSWSLNISGHMPGGDSEEQQILEEGLLEEARKFVASIDRELINTASGSFQYLGSQSLFTIEDDEEPEEE